MTPETIVALAALLTAFGSLWIGVSTRRKANAEQQDIATRTYLSLIKPLEDQIKTLQDQQKENVKHIAELEELVKDLTHRSAVWETYATELLAGIALLSNQIVANSGQPIWKPRTRPFSKPGDPLPGT